MNAPVDKNSKELLDINELSDIFKNESEYTPKHPDKVVLPLMEFEEFYFKSVALKGLDNRERKWLATMDVLACICALTYDKNVHEAVSNLYQGDLKLLYADYNSKLLFLKEQQ